MMLWRHSKKNVLCNLFLALLLYNVACFMCDVDVDSSLQLLIICFIQII
jgi:hypothetical protein